MEAIERQVCATVQEFTRGLGQAFPGRVAGEGLSFAVACDSAAMAIDLVPGPDRVIALLRLPQLTVRIRFTAGSAEARQAMLAHMDRTMQRGGG